MELHRVNMGRQQLGGNTVRTALSLRLLQRDPSESGVRQDIRYTSPSTNWGSRWIFTHSSSQTLPCAKIVLNWKDSVDIKKIYPGDEPKKSHTFTKVNSESVDTESLKRFLDERKPQS
jgi:hypothetical protein